MAKQVVTTVYTYAELLELHKEGKATAKAVDAAKQWLREANTDHDWWDSVYEMWKSALDQVGFEAADIAFSGFWSQGDGASFTAKLNIEKLIRFLSTEIKPNDCISFDGKAEDFLPFIVHKIKTKTTESKYRRLLWCVNHIGGHVKRISRQYSHESTCRAEVYGDFGPRVSKLVAKLEADVEELRRNLSQAIYRSLEDDYEDLTGDECIEDFANANEYTFTIHGKRFG